MKTPFPSTYVDAGARIDGPALRRESGAILAALGGDERPVIAAVANRRRLAALVAACLGSGRGLVFPHGFSSAVLRALVASHGARLVHDREGGEGLDLRALPAADVEGPDLSRALHETRDRARLSFMTSGTTGAPRTVTKSASQVLDEAAVLAELLALDDGSSLALGVPSTHLFGFLFGIALPCVRALEVQAPLVRTRADLVTATPTWFVGAPPTIQSFVHGAPSAGPFGVVASGAALPPGIADAARDAGASRVVEIFGSTETGGIGSRERSGDAFTFLRGVDAREAEDGALVTSPFTGGRPTPISDRLSLGAEGFRFVERDADVVKIGGRRISVGAVEALIRAVPGVVDVAVRPRPASLSRGHRLAALVVGEVSLDEVRAALRAALDPEFVPRAIVHVPRIARGGSGKLPIDAFARQLESGSRTARAGIALRAIDAGFEATVPPGSSRFEGHFPGDAILPGVSALVDLVLPMVHATHVDLAWPRRLVRVKFMRPIRPSDTLRATLDRRGPDQLAYELRSSEGERIASGNLDFGAAEPASRSAP